jgi:hypothetical protein
MPMPYITVAQFFRRALDPTFKAFAHIKIKARITEQLATLRLTVTASTKELSVVEALKDP